MPNLDARVFQPPSAEPGAEWLLRAGRALMAWWNDQGPVLPPDGERYRVWWRRMDATLSDPSLWGMLTGGPSGILPTLQGHGRDALRYWREQGSQSHAPPLFGDAPWSSMRVAIVGGGIVLALIAGALIYGFFRNK
jgi:hypothetical protein